MDSKATFRPRGRTGRFTAIAASAVLATVGLGAIVTGLHGRSTVRDGLAQEHVVGTPDMTPAAIAAEARAAGLRGVTAPDCAVAGISISGGAEARCFAQYMRIHTLMATRGTTYSQMPGFIGVDGKPTNNAALAKHQANGQPVENPAHRVWVTETAMTSALNMSYIAEQISLFGIVIGGALLLVGLALVGLALSGARVRRTDDAHAPLVPAAGALVGA